ncbi:MAG: hypothetical protein ABL958_13885, partial [Bdellovibrionia bacterium]
MRAITHRISRLKIKQDRVSETLNRIFSFRLASGGTAVVLLAILSLGYRSPWIVVGLLVLSLVFLRLLAISRKIRRYQQRLAALQLFYERQKHRLEGHPPTTPQPRVPSDALATDLDFFGPHSLLSQIDETVTDDGRAWLARLMMNPPLDAEAIGRRQAEVRNLSLRAGYLRRLAVIAGADLETRPAPFSIALLQTPLVEEGFERRHLILWILFGAYTVTAIASAAFSLAIPVGAVWFAYFMFSMFALGKSAEAFNRIQSLGIDGQRLTPLFGHLEKMEPKLRARLLPRLNTNPLSPALRRVDRLTDLLSVQTHPLVAVLVNGFVPWSYFFAARAEKLRQELET